MPPPGRLSRLLRAGSRLIQPPPVLADDYTTIMRRMSPARPVV